MNLNTLNPTGHMYSFFAPTQNTLPTGDLDSSSTALNLTNGQIAVLSQDESSTLGYTKFLGASVTAASTNAIKIVQGGPNAATKNLASAFKVNNPAKIESGVLKADKIISVTTKLPELPSYDMTLWNGFTTPTDSLIYEAGVVIESAKMDMQYGLQKRHREQTSVTILASATNNTHYYLSEVAYKLNQKSKNANGRLPYMVLALDYGGNSGSSGTVIGTMKKGDAVPFITIDGVSYSFTADIAMINALNKAITSVSALSTAEIVNINSTSHKSATGSVIDALLIIGLDEKEAVVVDENISNKVRLTFFSQVAATTKTQVSGAVSDGSLGKYWALNWKKTQGLNIYNQQYKELGDYDITPDLLYNGGIVATTRYTATIIEYYDTEQAMPHVERYGKKAIILLAAEISDETANADTGYTVVTTNSTLVTNLNAVIGAWLSSASDSYSRIDYKESATKAAPFV